MILHATGLEIGFFNSPMISKLLGHNQVETTARYAHLARDSVQEAAERIAGSIAADILGEGCRHASGQNPAYACRSHGYNQ